MVRKKVRLLAWVCLLLALTLCFPCAAAPTSAGGNPSVSAKACLLLEAQTGAVLFSKEGDRRLPMASTTKVMTALLVLELLPLEKTVTVPKEAVGTEGTSLYLTEGEQLTVEDLLYALLLRSANDAAVTLAIAAAGTVEAFAEAMNRKAQALGLTDTHFTNPHGLPDDAHYTTAYDLARIAAAAMQNQDFAAIVNCRQKRIVPKKGMPRLLSNHNKLLRLSEDAVGVKTGFTKKSGRCLVGAAEKNGLLLISVTLDAPDDWNDHLSLFRYGFSLCKRRTPYEAGEFAVSLDVAGGQKERVCAVNQYALSLPQVRDEAYRIFVSCNLFVTAPIKAGQVLGSVAIRTARGEETVPLVAAEDVPAPKSGKPFFRLFRRESTEHHDPPETASGTD